MFTVPKDLTEKGFKPLTLERIQLNNAHAAVGLATFILSTLYPFISLLRPLPFESKFKLFNIAYEVLWYCIICTAFTAIGLANHFSGFDLAEVVILLPSFVAFYILFHAMLMFYTKYVGQNQIAISSFMILYLSGSIVTTVAIIEIIAN